MKAAGFEQLRANWREKDSKNSPRQSGGGGLVKFGKGVGVGCVGKQTPATSRAMVPVVRTAPAAGPQNGSAAGRGTGLRPPTKTAPAAGPQNGSAAGRGTGLRPPTKTAQPHFTDALRPLASSFSSSSRSS